MSTFVVECDAETWGRAGFASMGERDGCLPREALWASPGVEQVCMAQLQPAQPPLACGNTVLIGDALRTAHFSIGSGTRLAMEDAIALAKALDNSDSSRKL